MAGLQHTGLTPAVLAYNAPNAPIPEAQQPKDRAFFADPKKGALLSAASQVRHLTPYIGTELSGIQLSQLNDAQKDELALLAAEVYCTIARVMHLDMRLIAFAARSGPLPRSGSYHRSAIRPDKAFWTCK